LLRAAEIDRPHREARLHAEEGRHRDVDTGDLLGDEALEHPAPGREAVALEGHAGDVEPGEPGDDVLRELAPEPPVVDDGRDLAAHEVAHPELDLELLGPQLLAEAVEVAVR